MAEMEGISDIRICGLDEARPPRIRKQPYIDLYFKLSHQAPKKWCEDFNSLTASRTYKAMIDSKNGEFIESWVREPSELGQALEDMKLFVETCNQAYIERILAQARSDAPEPGVVQESGPQAELNRMVAALNFD